MVYVPLTGNIVGTELRCLAFDFPRIYNKYVNDVNGVASVAYRVRSDDFGCGARFRAPLGRPDAISLPFMRDWFVCLF
jgi:hypothetical protein